MGAFTTTLGAASVRAAAMIATLLLALIAMPGGVLAQDDGGEREIVLAGASLTLAPFTFIDEHGQNVGFELDILDAIGEELGLELAIVRVPFEQNFNALNAGIFDVSSAAAFMRCERLQNPDAVGRFTVPTYTASHAVSTRSEDIDAVATVKGLDGLVVGVESHGSTADDIVEGILADGGAFTKEVFPDNPSLFVALEQGRIDAAVQSEFAALWIARNNPAVGLAFRIPGTALPVGFLFRADDPRRGEFNQAIDELKTEGVIGDIYRRWFDEEPDPNGVSVNVVPEVTAEDVC